MTAPAYLGTLAYALGAGIATFFAPCAYPLLPGYVGYYVEATDGASPPMRGIAVRGLAASGGVLAVFSTLTVLVYLFGSVIVTHLEVVDPFVGASLVIVGSLALLDRGPTIQYSLPKRRRSVLGFLIFGIAYALAAAGCVLPVLGAVVLQSLQFTPLRATTVVATYALGVCALMLVVTILIALGTNARLRLPAGAWVEKVTELSGIVMILAGGWELYRSIVIFHAFTIL